jgi:enamine deaminase RidA (YjgF/YER057c/UK114 family)
MIGVGDPEAQCRFLFKELQRLLEQAGGSLADVTKLIVHLVSMADYPMFQKVRAEYFSDSEFPPTCSLVQVVALVRPQAVIGIEAIAVLA